MTDNFFDKSILENAKSNNDLPQISNPSKLTYHFKEEEGQYSFYCEIDNQRLNQSELKSLIKLNETQEFLSQDDIQLLNYLIHKLGPIQTIYKLINDIEIIFNHLQNSNFQTFYNDRQIKINNEEYKLEIDVHLDKASNVVIEINDRGEFFFGATTIYYLENEDVFPINGNLPIKLYKELITGKNRFSIETFFQIKDTILPKLKELHKVKISTEIEELTSLNLKEKVAKTVLEIGKTVHFITLNLRYKIGEEFFPIENYKYLETQTWLDKDTLIKIIKEDEGLVKYISNMDLSLEIFDELFDGIRMKYSRTEKTPFQLMVPIANLETFVRMALPKLEKEFVIQYKNGQKLTLSDGMVSFEVDSNLKRNLNLFEFKVRFKIGDEYFDLEFIKNLMLQNKKYVQLKNGSTANIENIREINKWIEFLNKFEFKKSGNTYKTEASAALELDEFLKDIQEKQVNSNEEYKNLIQEMKEKTPVEKIDLPEHIDPILRDYQKEGVYWLHFLKKYGFGGILADEMGLGKTVQALTIVAMNQGLGVTNIVVCPKSLIYNWENEAKKYFPNLKVLVIDKDSERRKKLIEEAKDYDLVITSYSMIQKDYAHYIENDLIFNYLILDEAHYVKNIKTLSSKAVRTLPARNKVLLTGTPLENNLDELYGTFELTMPNYLGSKTDFRRDFVSKIERNNTIALEILQAKIRPFILRRTKKEVLKELPDKQEQTVYNEMTNKQVAVYQEVLNRVKNDVQELVEKQGWEKSRIQVLSALLKLRQVCNHPVLADPSFENEEEISGKYEQFLTLLREVVDNGDKVLVFSQFTSMLDIFERELNIQKIKYVRLDGSTKDRQDVVDKFNEDTTIKVFLISLKAGGVGLNLTAANTVFLYDPWWNPMAEQQAVDRAHRIGQKQTVNIYKFITKNSIEEKILKLQERKGNLFENLVVENQNFIKKLEWEDLMELFD